MIRNRIDRFTMIQEILMAHWQDYTISTSEYLTIMAHLIDWYCEAGGDHVHY